MNPPPASDDPPPPREVYAQRVVVFDGEFAELTGRQNRLSNARLLSAAAALILTGWFVTDRQIIALIGAVVVGIGFLWLVVRHRHVSHARRRAAILRDINQEGMARIDREWDALPLSFDSEPSPDHPFAGDLDTLGHASVFQLLDTTATPRGSDRLAEWLTALAPPPEIRRRQDAVRELAPNIEWRQELQMLGRLNQSENRDPSAFLEWAEGDTALEGRAWLVWLARIGAGAVALVVVLAVSGIIPAQFVAVPLVANLVLSVAASGLIGDRVRVARDQHPALKSYSALLAHLDTQTFQSPLLVSLLDELGAHTEPAHEQVARLGRITSFAIPRSALSHIALQAAGNWDVHVLDRLERWQRANGAQVRGWLEIIGIFEALAALANLSYDNPQWTFAEVDSSYDAITATNLGHPLIADGVRVHNDVTVGPPGTFLLVTGSNMSGKSTLLRSIGVNVVLASAGGPSCASSLTLPPVDLWTSVRVTDSLEAGISYYMAELLRLKAVQVAAKEANAANRPFCYLLDEILQGTNSAERQIAARQIIAGLVDLGAIGAVSTHDLQLAEHPSIENAMVPVHFTDTFTDGPDGPEMSFDYRLRPGLATSTNALKLMQIVGFEPVVDAGLRS